MNRVQLTQFKRLGYRKAVGMVREGYAVYRLRPSGENRLVTDINEVSRTRYMATKREAR